MKNTNIFAKLLQQVSINKSKILFASVCSVLNKLCDIAPEVLIGISIDVVVNQKNSVIARMGIIDPFHQLYLVGALAALLWIFESVFEYLYSITWRGIAQDVQHELRLKTYATVLNLDIAYFENKTVGGLLNTLQDDINQLEQFLSVGPNEIIQLIVNIVVMGLIFLYLSPTLALIALLPIPFVVGIAFYFKQKLASLYESVRQASSNLASHIAYRLQGVVTIKSYSTEAYEVDQLCKQSLVYQSANRAANKVSAEYIPTVRMAIMVGFIMTLVVGGMYALQGKIPINWYAALVFLIQRFLWPFTSLTTITDMYERATACAKRILNILNNSPIICSGSKPLALASGGINGDIKFNDISFAYSNGVQIFNKINFEVQPKQTVAFVGPTGSGKSTIIKLLLRFYDPINGSILIDNQDIKDVDLKALRAAIALVSQDIYLVEGTIADNIAYGAFTPSEAVDLSVIEAAKMAQAHDFIMALPDGYATKVQENGKNLSGGQKQRLGIARAIFKKSPILVFDEATSAIDNETEAAIQESISKLKADHTIIIIAHRLSTVRNADTIFVLENGVITESGNHDLLLLRNGTYANLCGLQNHN